MRLKRIELAGFKSFVDPTKIDIGEGVTSIVGPNGCGKSNIVDAIRWVLGEHSARHLRGGVMDDLIFQGSDTRSPVAVCDVELTFAVQRGQLPSPYHEHDEVRIRRRMTREGGSDGFINGKMVRIKDIVDLFLDTGVSTRAYAIVEQGAIARMITAKPEERRALFEEAAGVMKYRSRRREAELKMNSTRQNLERAVDLLEEVRSQCRSLKQQASRAERFKQLQDEYQHVQAQSFAIRYWQHQQKLATVIGQLKQARTAEAASATGLAEAERVLHEARESWVAHEATSQQRQDDLRQVEQQRASLQQQAERQAGERRLLAERQQGLQLRIEEGSRRIWQLQSETKELQSQLAQRDDSELAEAQAMASAQCDTAQDSLHAARQQRDHWLAEFERLRSEFENLEKRQQQTDETLHRLNQRWDLLQTQLQETRVRAAAQQEHVSSMAEDARMASAAAREAGMRLEQAQSHLDACREQGQQAGAARQRHESLLRSLRGEVQELRAQLKSQDLPETLHEVISGVGGIWVDASLHVPEGLEKAVAAALRGAQADVVVPGGATALQALATELEGAPVALFTGENTSGTGVVSSLVDAIGLPAKHALHAMFAEVGLCDDVLAAGASAAVLVDRKGWRREPNGWLIPPSQNHTARRLELQRRLRESETALTEAEREHATAEQAVQEAESRLSEAQQAWQQAHVQLTEAQSAEKSLQASLRQLQDEQVALTDRLKHQEDEAAALSGDIQHWQDQQQSMSALDHRQRDAAQQELEQATEAMRQREQMWQQSRNGLAAAEQALALHHQANENLKRELSRLHQETAHLERRLQEDKQQLALTEEAVRQAAAHDDLDARLRQANEAVELAHAQLNEVRQLGHELQQQAHACERNERERRQAVQQAADLRQKIEIDEASGQARLNDMAEEIVQRFQVQPDALLARFDVDAEQDAGEVLARARELEERLNRFGPVNLLAIQEYEEAAEREGFLAAQAEDLESGLNTLSDTIARIDRTTRQQFRQVFEETNRIFKETFPRLFGGGRAELRLDSEDVLTAGVEVIAQPPGKRLQDVTLLSGGEKALTAVALVFSIFQIKPAPFCILDEVDAPLDDANVGRFGEMIRELSNRVQFLAISHNKMTMQMADRLVGVSMPEPGVSRIVSVDVAAMDKV